MNRDKGSVSKRKVTMSAGTSARSRKSETEILRKQLQKMEKKQDPRNGLKKTTSVSDLLTELLLEDCDKENLFDPLGLDDLRKKPDLWMAAFESPMDFIDYCKKRIDHERKLLEKSRLVEEEIQQFVQEWAKNTDKHQSATEDLYRVQDINDKLQEVVMEERTHCKHLVGLNDQLDSQNLLMSRKYQAALLLGKIDDKAVRHLLEKNPRAVPLTDKLSDLDRRIKKCDPKSKLCDVADPYILAERVESLENYIDELKKQHREEVAVLKETINHNDLKCESIKSHYGDLLHRNAKSLKEMREILGASVRENLDLRESLIKKDSEFFEFNVKEMTQKLTRKCLPPSNASTEIVKYRCEDSTVVERDYELKLARSEIDLEKKGILLRETVTKVIQLERKCARLEEENQVLRKTSEYSLKALKSRNVMLEKRCEKTESRLKLENVGILNDVREFKTLIKLLIRNVRSFTKEQADLKKKLSDVSKTVGTPKEDAAAIRQTLLTANQTQSQSDLKLHAMNLWVDYLSQKASSIEDEMSTGKTGHSQYDDTSVLFTNPSTIQNSHDVMRIMRQNRNTGNDITP